MGSAMMGNNFGGHLAAITDPATSVDLRIAVEHFAIVASILQSQPKILTGNRGKITDEDQRRFALTPAHKSDDTVLCIQTVDPFEAIWPSISSV